MEYKMTLIANTPSPPYYAVIFVSKLNESSIGYTDMADKMVQLASNQTGFLGFESAREDVGIAVSYWSDLEAVKKWKANADHLQAQKTGREKWYSEFKVRVAKVEREYGL